MTTYTPERTVTENPLKILLDETGISQRELARLLGLTSATTIHRRAHLESLRAEDHAFFSLLLNSVRAGRDIRELLKEISKTD